MPTATAANVVKPIAITEVTEATHRRDMPADRLAHEDLTCDPRRCPWCA